MGMQEKGTRLPEGMAGNEHIHREESPEVIDLDGIIREEKTWRWQKGKIWIDSRTLQLECLSSES